MIGNSTTIAAVATPPGSGGIAVIRLSGPDAMDIAEKVWKGRRIKDMAPRHSTLGSVLDSSGQQLDQTLVTVFRAPASFTGEDTVEFAVHGSSYIQKELLRSLMAAGASPAGPGEFTQRAFLNGRLDLAQAEAVGDIIAAQSAAANRLAQQQAAGALTKHLQELRDKLIELASLLELELDFSEEDVTFADRSRLRQLAGELESRISVLLDTYASGKAFREGIPVAIVGAPNAGKSTLLNALLGDDRAIVSDIPGTTRDTIQDTVIIDGILFRLIDTAGLRETADEIERLGIDRSLRALRSASIVLHLIAPESSNSSRETLFERNSLSALHSPSDSSESSEIYDFSLSPDQTILLVQTKSDLCEILSYAETKPKNESRAVRISAKTGEGLDVLRRMLVETATVRHNPDTELLLTNERHYVCLKAARESLGRVSQGLENGLSADFIAQDLRETLHHLGTVTGSVTTSDLLASIFSRFCIGK